MNSSATSTSGQRVARGGSCHPNQFKTKFYPAAIMERNAAIMVGTMNVNIFRGMSVFLQTKYGWKI
jgi:hypothetical protein